MKKIILILLVTLSFGAKAQTLNRMLYDSIQVGKTAGTSGISLYGKVYLKNVGLGLVSDSILTVVNGRIRKIPVSGVAPDSTVYRTVANSVSLAGLQTRLNLKANLASPTFTGTVTAPTFAGALTGNASTVTNGVYTTGNQTIGGSKIFSNDVVMSGATVQTLSNGLVKSSGGVLQQAVSNTDFLPVSSPAMTGTPTAPTATAGTSTGQIATTSFVTSAVSAGGVWTRSGTTLSPTTANDVVSITASVPSMVALDVIATGSNATAIYATSTGNGVTGVTSGSGYAGGVFTGSGANVFGVRGQASDGKGGDFYNNSATYATIYANNVGGGNIAEFANGGGIKALINNAGGAKFGTTSTQLGPSETIAAYNNTASFALSAVGTSSGVSPVGIWNTATTGDNAFTTFYTEASVTARGSISYNRGAGLVAYNTTSDYRIKTDITPIEGAIGMVSKLQPKNFRMFNAPNKALGFIAHELQAVVPQAVTGTKDAVDTKGKPILQQVDISQVVPLLTKAIQEQQAIITALEARIKALELK